MMLVTRGKLEGAGPRATLTLTHMSIFHRYYESWKSIDEYEVIDNSFVDMGFTPLFLQSKSMQFRIAAGNASLIKLCLD